MALRIFMTGSGGIVGRHVVKALCEATPAPEVIRNAADLTDPAETRRAVERAGKIDLVIHLAAMVPVDAVAADPARAFTVNVSGTINLLAALTDTPAGVLLCSSAHVYAPSAEPLREDARTVPQSLYGRTKLMAEQAAREICTGSGRRLCIARLFSIHDPDQRGSYLRPALLRRFASLSPGEEMTLEGGNSLRDFLPASRAGALLAKLGIRGTEGTVNVASGKATRVADFARTLAPFPLNITPTGDARHLIADVTRLHKLLGETNDHDGIDHHPDLQSLGHAAPSH